MTASAIPEARAIASSFVCGLSFQFPLMNGLRAISNAKVRGALVAGAKALAAPTRERREMVLNFIVFCGGVL